MGHRKTLHHRFRTAPTSEMISNGDTTRESRKEGFTEQVGIFTETSLEKKTSEKRFSFLFIEQILIIINNIMSANYCSKSRRL
jgi:hypothetical protein